MGTVQGFGTRFYGWRHKPDSTATATEWFAMFYLPVIPLRRYELRVLTDFTRREPFFVVPTEGFFGGLPTGVQVDHYQILARSPLVVAELLRTLLLTYVVGPILMSWPVVFFFLYAWALDAHPQWKNSDLPFYLIPVLAMVIMGNAVAVPLIALRRTRGFRGALFG